MSKIVVTDIDAVFCHIDGDIDVIRAIHEEFQYEIPNAKFHPKVRHGVWDGIIRLFNINKQTLYKGLKGNLYKYCKDHNIEIESKENNIFLGTSPIIPTSPEAVNSFLDWVPKKYDLRDYQREAFDVCVERGRTILLSPTASGKSFIIYMLAMWHVYHKQRVLLIVPNVSLVKQLKDNFEEYYQSPDIDIHVIDKGIKDSDASITITTWQAIYNQSTEWYESFGCIIGDECHTFKANSLRQIMERSRSVEYRFGFTGTLDKSKTHEMMLKSLFGDIHRVISTSDLIESGQLSSLDIKCVKLVYGSNKDKKDFKSLIDAKKDSEGNIDGKKKYDAEVEFILQHGRRNTFISNLANKLQGNTIVLFRYVESHGKPLYNIISNLSDRPVYYIDGDVGADERERIRKKVEKEGNSIIVASYGTMSTGVDIPSIANIVLSSPSKSKITNLQSIGRGLRKSSKKDVCTVFDLFDDLRFGSKRHNITMKHFIERAKVYDEEKLQYHILSHNL